MALTLSERYSALVDIKLRSMLRFGLIWNRRYEGDPKAGAVNIPARDLEVTLSDYDRQQGVVAQFAEGNYIKLTIDQDIAAIVIIDGYEDAAVPDSIVADRLDSMGHSFGLFVEKYLIEVVLKATEGNPASIYSDTNPITKTNVYETLVNMNTVFSERKISTMGRTFSVLPKIKGLLMLDTLFRGSSSDIAVEDRKRGIVGDVDGTETLMLQELVGYGLPTGGYNGAGTVKEVEVILTHFDFMHFVNEWQVMPKTVSLENSHVYVGASAIKGRQVFDALITKSDRTILVKLGADGGAAPASASAKGVAKSVSTEKEIIKVEKEGTKTNFEKATGNKKRPVENKPEAKKEESKKEESKKEESKKEESKPAKGKKQNNKK